MATQARGAMVACLFESYFERVYRFARRTADPATAEEVAQDVFLKLLNHKDLENKVISVSYLIKIADNMLKRRHRKAARSRELLSGLARRRVAEGAWATNAQDNQFPLGTELPDAFDRLPRHERDAVRMIVCEGLTYDEAAEALGVRVSTVNNWKYRGVQRLKEDPSLRAQDGDEPAARRARPDDGEDTGFRRRGRPRKVAGAPSAARGDLAA